MALSARKDRKRFVEEGGDRNTLKKGGEEK